MKNQFLESKSWVVVLVFLMVLTLAFSVFARGGYHWHGGSWHDGGWHGGGWHRWYGPDWFGVYVGVPDIEPGIVVDELPYGYNTVIVGGAPYYYFDSIYYRAVPDGYVVVPAPGSDAGRQSVSPTASNSEPSPLLTQEKESGAVTINVPNSKGGFNPVTLKKYKKGYLGPQGEYYEGNPTVEQLKMLYGK